MGYLDEAGDVGTVVVVTGNTILFGGIAADVVDVLHNLFELLVGVLKAPGLATGVLLHLQGRDGYASGADGFSRAESNAGLQKGTHGLRRAGHVGPFAESYAAVLDQLLGVALFELVLGGAGQG